MTTLDFETQNLINHYRNMLDDIREWREQLSDTITTITGYSMDLSGVTTNHTPRLPGGDALAMLAPYSDGNTEPDDTPHPAQIIIEGAHLIDRWQGRAQREYTLTEAFHRNSEALPWLHQNGHLQAWAQDINTLWSRLGRLTGNIERKKEIEIHYPGGLKAWADDLPDDARLTLKQADEAWPGHNIGNKVRVHRHRERKRAEKEHRPPNYLATPDATGRYAVKDLKKHFKNPVAKKNHIGVI